MPDEIKIHNHYWTKDEILNLFQNKIDNRIAEVWDNETFQDAIDQHYATKEEMNQRAIANHKSESDVYGVGDRNYYGHVKLSDSTTSESGASNGVAATPYAVKEAYNKGNNTNTRLTTVKNNIIKNNRSYTAMDLNTANFRNFGGSFFLVRNGWCFLNLYATITDDPNYHYVPPMPLVKMKESISPETDFVEGAAQAVGTDTTRFREGHAAGRYHGTIQIVRTNADPEYPYEAKFFSEINLFDGELIFGTIAYPIRDYNSNLE